MILTEDEEGDDQEDQEVFRDSDSAYMRALNQIDSRSYANYTPAADNRRPTNANANRYMT